MKIKTFFLFVALCLSSEISVGQVNFLDSVIDINVENKTIAEFLKQDIQPKDYSFRIEGNLVGETKFTFKYTGTVRDLITLIAFNDLEITDIEDDFVYIQRKPPCTKDEFKEKIEKLLNEINIKNNTIDSLTIEQNNLAVKNNNLTDSLTAQKTITRNITAELDSFKYKLPLPSNYWLKPSMSIILYKNSDNIIAFPENNFSYATGMELSKDLKISKKYQKNNFQVSIGLKFSQINASSGLQSYSKIDSSRYNLFVSDSTMSSVPLDTFYINNGVEDIQIIEYEYIYYPVYDSTIVYDTLTYKSLSSSEITYSFVEIPIKLGVKFHIGEKLTIIPAASLYTRFLRPPKGIVNNSDNKLIQIKSLYEGTKKIFFSYSAEISAEYNIKRDISIFGTAIYAPFTLPNNIAYNKSNFKVLYFSFGISHRL